MQVHLQNLQVEFLCQGHRVKVEVTGARSRRTDRLPVNSHLHSPDGDTNITPFRV